MGRKREKMSKDVVLSEAAQSVHDACNTCPGLTKRNIMDQIAETAEYKGLTPGVDFSDYDVEDAMNFYDWDCLR